MRLHHRHSQVRRRQWEGRGLHANVRTQLQFVNEKYYNITDKAESILFETRKSKLFSFKVSTDSLLPYVIFPLVFSTTSIQQGNSFKLSSVIN